MKRRVQLTQTIEVEIDEAKFTAEFLSDFRASFYDFHDINDHLEHLAQLYARGLIDAFGDSFIEGYGPQSSMGIKFISSQVTDMEVLTDA